MNTQPKMTAVDFATRYGNQLTPEFLAELATLMGHESQPTAAQPTIPQVDPLERVLELLANIPQNMRDKFWSSIGNGHIAGIGRILDKGLSTPFARSALIKMLRSEMGQSMLAKAGINIDQLAAMIDSYLPMVEMAMGTMGIKPKSSKVSVAVYKNWTSVPFAVDVRRTGWFKPILTPGTSRVDYLVDLPSVKTPIHAIVIDGNLPDLVIAAVCIRKWSLGKDLRVTPAMTAFLKKINMLETGMGYPTFHEYHQVGDAMRAVTFAPTQAVELLMGLLEELEEAPQVGFQNLLNEFANSNKLGFNTVGEKSPVDKTQVAMSKLLQSFKGIGFK